jgi:uncharacterized membrane protein
MSRICYLGDDHLGAAAIYLAGVMTHFGMEFDHVPSADRLGDAFLQRRYGLYVLSDYSAANVGPEQMNHLVDCVRSGSGLAMFGGWESYHGRLGEYHRTPLVDVLPVTMLGEDDRRNCFQPCLVHKVAEHAILDGLPWDCPPCIGGFNAFTAKPQSQAILTARAYRVRRNGEEYEFVRSGETPLLVVGRFGQGRTLALATDVAPHWVGGLVDWGDRRVTQEVGGGFIEVGNWYVRLFGNMLKWCGGERE